ncbi:MAG: DUF1801 domain-containing protein [Gemmatimonadales bacterium]|jgi:hypothetical protein
MPAKPPSTVSAFLAGQPASRRTELQAVLAVVRKNLPAGYEEAVVKGMVVWQVPLARYPDTYNGHALWYAALAAQKNYLSLYLMNAYGDPGVARRLKEGFKAAGKKLDMGKSCVHFKMADDLALDAIGEAVASTPLARWVAAAMAVRRKR